MYKTAILLAAVTLAMLVGACGSTGRSVTSHTASSTRGPSSSPPRAASAAPAAAPVAVTISSYAFHPRTITVSPGQKVTFTNRDQTAHTATSSTSAFDTGTVNPGQSVTITLTHPGTYTYYCQFHAFMSGSITVVK